MQLIEFDLVDGGAYDCVPHNLIYVESFDTLKNEAFPDAETFVLYQSETGQGHLLTTTTLEDIGEAIRETNPADWFEVTSQEENRVLVRRSSVSARRSVETGTELTVMVGGSVRILPVKEDMATIRSMMKTETLALPPEGLQLVEPQPAIAPLPEPEPAPEPAPE